MKVYALLSLAAASIGVPFAVNATYVTLQPDTPGTVEDGNINVSGTVKGTTIVAYSPTLTGIAYGGDFRSVSTQGRGILGNASATTGVTYGGLFQSFSTSGRGVAGITAATSGVTVGGFFTTNSPDGMGVEGSANASSGLCYGVYGRTSSPAGYGVYSVGNMAATGIISGNGSGLTNVNASTLQGYGPGNFMPANPAYIQLAGAWGTDELRGDYQGTTGGTSGVHGLASSTGSASVYGVFGEASTTAGRGVFGDATAATGSTTGVYAHSASTTGRAMVAIADAASGNTRGLIVSVNSPTAWGIDARSNATSGAPYAIVGTDHSPGGGHGVFGQELATTGLCYGTVGRCDSTAGYGVYSVGDTGASGTKSFRIDHPFDPANKYLLHYSTESPYPQNFYSGNATTDANGYAWVTLPDYFEEINTNYKYQLTIVDDRDAADFVAVKVSKKIRQNRFQIRTSAPNVEVSWRVEADRNDLYVRRKQPKDVLDKEGPEIGTYQHPELYHQDRSKVIFPEVAGVKRGSDKP